MLPWSVRDSLGTENPGGGWICRAQVTVRYRRRRPKPALRLPGAAPPPVPRATLALVDRPRGTPPTPSAAHGATPPGPAGPGGGAPVFGTNCTVVSAPGGDCVVVDAGAGVADAVVAHVRSAGLVPRAVLATHGHVDHTWDCR